MGNYFSEVQILEWFSQIVQGIKYCHDHKILHGDIIPNNILVTKDNQIKLDFGISHMLAGKAQ